MKKLTKNETSQHYKLIRQVAWHLANEIGGVSSEQSERTNQYYKIERHLKRAFLEYDRENKLAKSLQDISSIEKYLKAKTFPKNFFTATAKKSTGKKSTAKTKRV